MTRFRSIVFTVLEFCHNHYPSIVRGYDHHYILRRRAFIYSHTFSGFLANQLLRLITQDTYYRYLYYLSRPENTRPLDFVTVLPGFRTAQQRQQVIQQFEPELQAFALGRGLAPESVDYEALLPSYVLAHLFLHARGVGYA